MNIELNKEETEVLADILTHELDRLQIETLRTDSIAYHKLMKSKTDLVERVLKKIAVEQKA